jgi:hypothetical protein
MAAAASLRGEEMSRMSRLQGCAHEGARGRHAGGGDEQQAAGGRGEAAGCKTRGTRCCSAEAGCGRLRLWQTQAVAGLMFLLPLLT